MTAHRFLDSPHVTPQEILNTAANRTAAACSGRRIVAAQDTTESNFSGRSRGRKGLGPAGDGKTPGFFCHAMVAVDVESEAVLGVVHAHIWTRPTEETAARRSRRSPACFRHPSNSHRACRFPTGRGVGWPPGGLAAASHTRSAAAGNRLNRCRSVVSFPRFCCGLTGVRSRYFRGLGAESLSGSCVTRECYARFCEGPKVKSLVSELCEGNQTTSGHQPSRGKDPRRKSRPLRELRSAWRSEERYLGGNRTRLIGSRPRRRSLPRCENSP